MRPRISCERLGRMVVPDSARKLNYPEQGQLTRCSIEIPLLRQRCTGRLIIIPLKVVVVAFESGKEEDACSSRPLPVYLFAEPEVTWDKGQEHTTTTALVWVGGHSRRRVSVNKRICQGVLVPVRLKSSSADGRINSSSALQAQGNRTKSDTLEPGYFRLVRIVGVLI